MENNLQDDNTLLINQKGKCQIIKYHLKNSIFEVVYLILRNYDPSINQVLFLSLI